MGTGALSAGIKPPGREPPTRSRKPRSIHSSTRLHGIALYHIIEAPIILDNSRPMSFNVSARGRVYATNLPRLQRETSKRRVREAHSILTTAILLPQRLRCYWGKIVSLRTLINLRLADMRLTTAQQRTKGQNLPSDLYIPFTAGAVGVATDYGLHGTGVGIRVPVGVIMFSRLGDRLWGAPSLLSARHLRLSFTVKLQGRQGGHSHFLYCFR
jgi:hypothetical protein